VDERVGGMRRSGGCDGGDKAKKGNFGVDGSRVSDRRDQILHLPAPEDFCPTNELAEKRKNNNKSWQ